MGLFVAWKLGIFNIETENNKKNGLIGEHLKDPNSTFEPFG